MEFSVGTGRCLAFGGAGQLLGACNDTGRSGDPHLHYDLRNEAGEYVDPVEGHDCE